LTPTLSLHAALPILQAALQTMIAPQLRGPFHEPQIAPPLDRHRRVVECLVRLHATVGREEPDLVTFDGTAQGQIGLVVLALVRRSEEHTSELQSRSD